MDKIETKDEMKRIIEMIKILLNNKDKVSIKCFVNIYLIDHILFLVLAYQQHCHPHSYPKLTKSQIQQQRELLEIIQLNSILS